MLQSEPEKTRGLRRLLLLAAKALVVFYLVLDAVFEPIFRPFMRWFAELRFVLRLQAIVAALPPYGILVLLAIPFGLAELAKFFAVILIATGHPQIGGTIFFLAYLFTVVFVERVYNAGKDKLRTIRWVAQLMDWVFALRDRLLAWAKATSAWAFALRVKRRGAEVVKRLRVRFGLG